MRRPGAGGWARLLLGAVGLAAMGIGVFILLTDPFVHRPLEVVKWLVGADLLHEAVVVPAVLALGALLRPRGALRAGLISAGCVTAVALPMLLAPRPHANPTVLPLDYPRDWLVTLGLIAVLTALASARRTRRKPANGDGDRGGSAAAERRKPDADDAPGS